jgi:hypothetical protein
VTAPDVSITPFPGNPFEATLVLSDDIVFTAIKVQATGENSFSQCYRDGAPCEVHDAGEPGNFVIFEFPGGTSETAGFNVRSSNTEVGDWGTVNFFVRPAGETAFQGPFPKTP